MQVNLPRRDLERQFVTFLAAHEVTYVYINSFLNCIRNLFPISPSSYPSSLAFNEQNCFSSVISFPLLFTSTPYFMIQLSPSSPLPLPPSPSLPRALHSLPHITRPNSYLRGDFQGKPSPLFHADYRRFFFWR